MAINNTLSYAISPRRYRAWVISVIAVTLIGTLLYYREQVAARYQSIYWYQFKPTSEVMWDMKHGSGVAAPASNPLEQNFGMGHGWISEEVDLARVALNELLIRDSKGNLSAAERQELDNAALANFGVPVTSPVQCYLNEELDKRVRGGKLTAQQQSSFFQRIFIPSLTVRQKVIQGDRVPVRFRYRTAAPSARWEIVTTLKASAIDDKPVTLEPNFPTEWLAGGWDINIDKKTICSTLGKHRLHVEFLVEAKPDGRDRASIHTDVRTLDATFEVTQSPLQEVVKLVDRPDVEPAIRNGLKLTTLRFHIWHPGDVFATFEASNTPVSYAFEVYARFNGQDWPLGHITHSSNATKEYLRIDSDYEDHPVPKPPAKVDIVFKSSRTVATTSTDMYEVWNGEIVFKDVVSMQ